MVKDIQPLLVINHGPLDDVGQPSYVRADAPKDAEWDITHIPDGTTLFSGEVVASLQQRILELEQKLAEPPVLEQIPESQVFFGLCCQLEDPSDDEEHGWRAGVSWAQSWLVHTERATRAPDKVET